MANTELSLPNNSSMPFFLPKMLSPAPVIAPDKPALRPDWSRTVAIKPNAEITSNTTKAIFIFLTPSGYPMAKIRFHAKLKPHIPLDVISGAYFNIGFGKIQENA